MTTKSFGVTSPKGFKAAGGTCGIKVSGKPDLTLIVSDVPAAAAGMYTTSKMPSAPVVIGRRHLRSGTLRAVIVNSGNANASTGKPGEHDALMMCKRVSVALGCDLRKVIPSSTGIIGRPLPMEKITAGIDDLVGKLAVGAEADEAAARGIMTTDLVPKSDGKTVKIGKETVTIAGISKGSGMIAPNMATMLAFVTTDVAITPGLLKRALKVATGASFNRISVDQHTSPSDTVVTMASGLAGNLKITKTGKDFDTFTQALTDVCQSLAYQIVKDGEGATKVFRVRVVNAKSPKDADKIGRAVVDSPLVKCAIHGGDPNWGRVTTAAGYAGAAIRPEKMSLSIGLPTAPNQAVLVFKNGEPTKLTAAQQTKLQEAMKAKEMLFVLDIGLGSTTVDWLGCDLSREYIRINADYTT